MTDIEYLSFGKYLNTERKLRSIPLEEIAVATKIKLEYLRAIEEDSFESLPNETFVKGYIRAYAKYCGLNEDEVLVNYEFFDQLKHPGKPGKGKAVEMTKSQPKKQSTKQRFLLLVLLIIISVLLSFLFATLVGPFGPFP